MGDFKQISELWGKLSLKVSSFGIMLSNNIVFR